MGALGARGPCIALPHQSAGEHALCGCVNVLHQQGWDWPGEWLRGLEPGIEAAINPGETENRRSAGWLIEALRSKPTSADTIRSQARLRFVCGVCARGMSHCRDVLLSTSAVMEPSTRSPLCSLSPLKVHTQPLSWPELGTLNLTFSELLDLATREPFGGVCVYGCLFPLLSYGCGLKMVQGRLWISLTCPLGSLQLTV